ncbi:hypothetical protein VITU102760_24470 [Vibrio tubiashii]|jgi:hypothetical protein|uniref:Uncharacterized protein n=1 Tax=Vibrio tubiashii ATCC 19109 TaxID=1051646 RepID=F9T5D8_9VIBR|nr:MULTISPECIES: hypothetical protein [Vibrio oreintalis group]AIW17418.1 hypothetical protein IX91_25515 [Vibrio tubiashii ATCC 19109]EGU55335.1 hypothetical protein VITU9109_21354 [Vibrio tubiashii ATCC 19109]EIF04384.1 hypothetical protein VT1337_08456 [Vibrio tubiashii NCIMB 1337 = ATCC 19106]MDC5841095.1 hypothetical protein [Vibrio europaeus]
MDVYAVKLTITSTMKCYQQKLIPISFLDAKLEMKNNLRLFSFLPITGIKAVDKAIMLDVENASIAKSWTNYFSALESALNKIKRYYEIIQKFNKNEHSSFLRVCSKETINMISSYVINE